MRRIATSWGKGEEGRGKREGGRGKSERRTRTSAKYWSLRRRRWISGCCRGQVAQRLCQQLHLRRVARGASVRVELRSERGERGALVRARRAGERLSHLRQAV